MKPVLAHWNALSSADAARAILPCCGSQTWADALTQQRPFATEAALSSASDAVWQTLPQPDWQQAFDSHPRIGETHPQQAATTESLKWSATEQQQALSPNEAARQALAKANRRYEARFDRIFIVCAAGRSAAEILGMLEARMHNDPATELRESAEQQRQITELRLRRWLESA